MVENSFSPSDCHTKINNTEASLRAHLIPPPLIRKRLMESLVAFYYSHGKPQNHQFQKIIQQVVQYQVLHIWLVTEIFRARPEFHIRGCLEHSAIQDWVHSAIQGKEGTVEKGQNIHKTSHTEKVQGNRAPISKIRYYSLKNYIIAPPTRLHSAAKLTRANCSNHRKIPLCKLLEYTYI